MKDSEGSPNPCHSEKFFAGIVLSAKTGHIDHIWPVRLYLSYITI